MKNRLIYTVYVTVLCTLKFYYIWLIAACRNTLVLLLGPLFSP